MGRIKKYCDLCNKNFLTNSKVCPVCNSEFTKTRDYCIICERDIVVQDHSCPKCGNMTYQFQKIKTRVKCLDCLEEFCLSEITTCPECNSSNVVEIECPCVFYPQECVKIFENETKE